MPESANSFFCFPFIGLARDLLLALIFLRTMFYFLDSLLDLVRISHCAYNCFILFSGFNFLDILFSGQGKYPDN